MGAYMIWSKSAVHATIPGDDGADPAPDPEASKYVEPKPQRNNGRELVRARGVLLFDAPPPAEKGNVCVIVFGHENSQSGFNHFGRAAHYVGLGGLVGGGATQIVEELLGRIRNIGHPF